MYDGPEQEGDRVITRRDLIAYYNDLYDGNLLQGEINSFVDEFLERYDSN